MNLSYKLYHEWPISCDLNKIDIYLDTMPSKRLNWSPKFLMYKYQPRHLRFYGPQVGNEFDRYPLPFS